jgi:hypothetical protein
LTYTNIPVLCSNGANLFAGTAAGVWRRALWQFTPSVTLDLAGGWNLISVPLAPLSDSTRSLFEDAASRAFVYRGEYVNVDTIGKGVGYWLKYPFSETVTIYGDLINPEMAPVTAGWNIIGSVLQPVAVSSISSTPPGIATSNFFGYNGSSYVVADSIQPGQGYWVKVNQSGTLDLSLTPSASPRAIRIVPTNELPPSPPQVGAPEGLNRAIPREYALHQNYPNPFNPMTVIRYQLPEKSHVTLKVYDLLGSEVATLVNGVEGPGDKSIVFDASNLSSGMYFYRLQAGSYMETRKLILLR